MIVSVTVRDTCEWRAEGGGGQGGHGPRAQALEGAPAQLVGANFKSRGEFLVGGFWAGILQGGGG